MKILWVSYFYLVNFIAWIMRFFKISRFQRLASFAISQSFYFYKKWARVDWRLYFIYNKCIQSDKFCNFLLNQVTFLRSIQVWQFWCENHITFFIQFWSYKTYIFFLHLHTLSKNVVLMTLCTLAIWRHILHCAWNCCYGWRSRCNLFFYSTLYFFSINKLKVSNRYI